MVLLGLAVLPALMFIRNLPQFMRARRSIDNCIPEIAKGSPPAMAVLVPARNEETGIESTLRCILANDLRIFEVVVMDDASTDRTAEVVLQIAASDSRVRLLTSTRLPDGWNGKQHACWQLAQAARSDWLVFLDADVQLSSDALSRIVNELNGKPRDLLSGFPFQITKSWSEKLLIPLMHVVLLGYLPLERMRASRDPAYGAGCGQLFIARKEAYFASGGHRSISGSRHDGLKLPRAFRSAGFVTDVFDAGDIARCRMYRTARQVMQGLLKNATEGIAQPKLIGVFSVLLLGGQSLPIFALAHALFWAWRPLAIYLLVVATVISYIPRAMATLRFRQSWFGCALNPCAVIVFIALQWWALVRKLMGLNPVAWRGRW